MSKPFKLTAPRALEHQEQAALFRYAAIQARNDPRWGLLNASQNGLAASSLQQAARAKACGMPQRLSRCVSADRVRQLARAVH